MKTNNVNSWFKTLSKISIATAILMMGTLAHAGVSEESAGLMTQYCEILEGMKSGKVEALKGKYCGNGINLPTTNRAAAAFMLELSHDTGTVRLSNWSSLKKQERESLEALEWDALNLSNAFVTRSVSDVF